MHFNNSQGARWASHLPINLITSPFVGCSSPTLLPVPHFTAPVALFREQVNILFIVQYWFTTLIFRCNDINSIRQRDVLHTKKATFIHLFTIRSDSRLTLLELQLQFNYITWGADLNVIRRFVNTAAPRTNKYRRTGSTAKTTLF